MQTFRVIRVSTTTGRVLKVVAAGFTTHERARLWLEGFGQDPSPRTSLHVEPFWMPDGTHKGTVRG